jgi:hypothetical protein
LFGVFGFGVFYLFCIWLLYGFSWFVYGFDIGLYVFIWFYMFLRFVFGPRQACRARANYALARSGLTLWWWMWVVAMMGRWLWVAESLPLDISRETL